MLPTKWKFQFPKLTPRINTQYKKTKIHRITAQGTLLIAPTGLLIPPSNTLIIYSPVSGGTSITALFLAGYLPGLLMGLSLMLVSGFIAKRRQYPKNLRPTFSQVLHTAWQAFPSLLLVLVIMGGIIFGLVTPTEASATAVIYSLILSMVIYREIKLTHLPQILLQSAITTAIVLLLIGASMGIS